MSILNVVATTDFRDALLEDVTAVQFLNTATRARATFDAAQFDDVHISTAVAFAGSGKINQIEVIGNSISASGWTFSNWDESDSITFRGTNLADTLTGSIMADTIFGGSGDDILSGGQGSDRLFGEEGDDKFLINFDRLPAKEVIDGGNGHDSIVSIQRFVDLTDTRISGVEELVFGFDKGSSITLNSSSIGTADGISHVTGTDRLNVLEIDGDGLVAVIDLSHLTFDNWDPEEDHLYVLPGVGCDMVIGSVMTDLIICTNTPSVSGGGGDDTLLSAGGGPENSIDGGAGFDTLHMYGFIGGSFEGQVVDFSTLGLLTGIEKLQFQEVGGDSIFFERAIFSAAQLTGITNIAGSTVSNILDIFMPTNGLLDLRSIVFDHWGDSLFFSDKVQITGTADRDTIMANAVGGSINGAEGVDVLVGAAGRDTILGGNGFDRLFGGGGDDDISGQLGNDIIRGGPGSDKFRYSRPSEGGDFIADFASGQDRFVLDDIGFGLKQGVATAAMLQISESHLAASAKVRFIFETDTGNLYFDSDGDGSGNAILIVTMTPGMAFAASDITIL